MSIEWVVQGDHKNQWMLAEHWQIWMIQKTSHAGNFTARYNCKEYYCYKFDDTGVKYVLVNLRTQKRRFVLPKQLSTTIRHGGADTIHDDVDLQNMYTAVQYKNLPIAYNELPSDWMIQGDQKNNWWKAHHWQNYIIQKAWNNGSFTAKYKGKLFTCFKHKSFGPGYTRYMFVNMHTGKGRYVIPINEKMPEHDGAKEYKELKIKMDKKVIDDLPDMSGLRIHRN